MVKNYRHPCIKNFFFPYIYIYIYTYSVLTAPLSGGGNISRSAILRGAKSLMKVRGYLWARKYPPSVQIHPAKSFAIYMPVVGRNPSSVPAWGEQNDHAPEQILSSVLLLFKRQRALGWWFVRQLRQLRRLRQLRQLQFQFRRLGHWITGGELGGEGTGTFLVRLTRVCSLVVSRSRRHQQTIKR